MNQFFIPLKRTTLHIPKTGPKHDSERGHLFFIINDPCKNRMNLIVPLDSFNDKCDRTCILNSGHKFIVKKSFINYSQAKIERTDDLMLRVKDGHINYEGLVNEPEHQRICGGFQVSRHVTPRISGYYRMFCV